MYENTRLKGGKTSNTEVTMMMMMMMLTMVVIMWLVCAGLEEGVPAHCNGCDSVPHRRRFDRHGFQVLGRRRVLCGQRALFRPQL